jgi:hypothetical protein
VPGIKMNFKIQQENVPMFASTVDKKDWERRRGSGRNCTCRALIA